MTTDDIRIGTDEGDTCNRLGCDGKYYTHTVYAKPPGKMMSQTFCGICGHGPDNEKEEPHDD